VFYFEAFDEPWKGGADPRDVEKHWGLYNENRTPKAAMAGGAP
jgi:exo-beta-1,3-glucanase (GH17 family)